MPYDQDSFSTLPGFLQAGRKYSEFTLQCPICIYVPCQCFAVGFLKQSDQ
uniref:Uncharacterized protein n=1 Tax=Molossus molossus TaxID=27622 RepID=A0A7J8HEJ3_MOLMO|nr:hypothetical protein HJG59_014467 [Molossus molossus]